MRVAPLPRPPGLSRPTNWLLIGSLFVTAAWTSHRVWSVFRTPTTLEAALEALDRPLDQRSRDLATLALARQVEIGVDRLVAVSKGDDLAAKEACQTIVRLREAIR